MRLRLRLITFSLTLLASSCFLISPAPVLAQQADVASQTADNNARDGDANFEVQLYLLLASNKAETNEKLPAMLEPVARQLRATLPFSRYSLAATLLNRVRNRGKLSFRGVGGPPFINAGLSPSLPSFYDFNLGEVRLNSNAAGRNVVQMFGFRFGARIPIQTTMPVGPNGGPAVTQWESTGINTDISIPEDEPVVVGTLSVQGSESFIIVIVAKRAGAR
jgi:hypothetical protein